MISSKFRFVKFIYYQYTLIRGIRTVDKNMKTHRFIGNFELKTGNLKVYDEEVLYQLKNVLKLRAGEKIILCDGKMNEGMAEIKEYGKNFVAVEILETNFNKNESERKVILYCAILKRENFELVVQKATEVGVKEIVPIITDRTIKLDIRQDRLKKIIKEAAEQSGRGVAPVLHDPIDFEKSITRQARNNANFFLDKSGQIFRLARSKDGLARSTSRTGIFVGPEGGWTSRELETAKTSGFEVISLGNTTLRAETAAIIGSYLAISGSESSR